MARPPRKRRRNSNDAPNTTDRETQSGGPAVSHAGSSKVLFVGIALLIAVGGSAAAIFSLREGRERDVVAAEAATKFVIPTGVADPAVRSLLEEKITRANESPSDVAAVIDAAAALEAGGFWSAAHVAYDRAAKLDPNDEIIALHRAIAMQRSGDFSRAYTMLRELAEQHPESAAIQHRLGLLAMEQGDTTVAGRAFSAAQAATPNALEPLVGLAFVALANDDAATALEHADDVLRLDENYAQAQFVRGRALQKLERTAEARIALARGSGGQVRYLADSLTARIEGYRVDRQSRMRAALRQFRATKSPAALQELAKFVRENPNDSEIAVNYAAALVELGDTKPAEQILTNVLQRERGNAAAALNLAQCHIVSNDVAAAQRVLNSAINAAPLNPELRVQRALVAARSGDEIAATRDLEAAIRAAPQHADALALLAKIHVAAGRTDEANELLARLRQAAPADARGYAVAGQIAARSGKLEAARDMLRLAELADPGHQAVYALRESIEGVAVRRDQ